MILSHGVKGLLTFEQIPPWGLVPIHLVTKFSSTLFILVFGISLAASYLPQVGTDRWPEKRNRLFIRGLKVFFWYKVLTIVEMTPLYSREDILATLLYKAFPVYVEILGFYALALLWVPLVLPLWKRAPLALKLALPVAVAFVASYLYSNFDFWGNETLQALLVEHEKHYTWGQLSRAPLILVGLLLGEWIARGYHTVRLRLIMASAFGAFAAICFLCFYLGAIPSAFEELVAVAKNEGKHPPELAFMLFSLGGASTILGFVCLGGERLAAILRPITTIGKDALQSFIFHIFVIFVFYRYIFGLWKSVSYPDALGLTLLLIFLTSLWVQLSGWVRRKSS